MLLGNLDDYAPEDFLKPSPANTNHSGWLAPDGKFYYCTEFLHDSVARIVAKPLGWASFFEWSETWKEGVEPHVDACEYLIRRGWIRCYGNDVGRIRWASDSKHRPTFEQRRELSDRGYDPDYGLVDLP